MTERLPAQIDAVNNAFTNAVKTKLLGGLAAITTESLEWLVMEHYQFSVANTGFLQTAAECTKKLAEQGVSAELERNMNEEDGHARMYRQAMSEIGTDMDKRIEFPATTRFLADVRALCSPNPSRALGALYATETAAIFEHETFFQICREISTRRGITYEGSLIKRFHDIHLAERVEQGHKDGLAGFVDLGQLNAKLAGDELIDRGEVHQGALDAIEAMSTWWNALLEQVSTRPSAR